MKKTGLFKVVLGILFLVVIFSWISNAGIFYPDESRLVLLKEFSENYANLKIGFFDIFSLIFTTLMYFSEKFIFILSVGAFYGVLSKTGKYRAWIDKIAESFKGRENVFLIISSILLVLLSSTFNYGLLFLIFIPFLIGIVLALGYDKTTAFITTFGSVILGEFGSTFGNNISITLNETLGTTFTTGIAYKIVLLLLGIAFLVIYILKAKHTNKKEENLNSFVGEKSSNKYSVVSLFVLFGILVVLLVLGCTNWVNVFKVNAFESLHSKILDSTFASNLLGVFYNTIYAQANSINTVVGALGTWSYQEMSIVLLLASLLVGRLYRIKHRDVLNSMTDGAKKMLVPAMLVLLTHSVFLASQYYYPVVANFILGLTSKFNVLLSSITMIVGTLFNVDMTYMAANAIPQIAAHGGNTTIILLMSQGIYGVISLIAPTSVLLLLGLSYLELPYTEYIKKIWKYVLILLAVLIALLLILSFIL